VTERDKAVDAFYATPTTEAPAKSPASIYNMPSTPAAPNGPRPAHQVFYDPVKTLAGPGSIVRSNLDRLGDSGVMTVEEGEAHVQTFASLALHEVGLPDVDAQRLHTLYTDVRLAPPSEERVLKWAEESRRSLRERFGAVEAQRLVTQVQALVDQHPALKKMFDEAGGLGAHPEVIDMLVDRALGRSGPTTAVPIGRL
jgi:hypothetical protein